MATDGAGDAPADGGDGGKHSKGGSVHGKFVDSDAEPGLVTRHRVRVVQAYRTTCTMAYFLTTSTACGMEYEELLPVLTDSKLLAGIQPASF